MTEHQILAAQLNCLFFNIDTIAPTTNLFQRYAGVSVHGENNLQLRTSPQIARKTDGVKHQLGIISYENVCVFRAIPWKTVGDKAIACESRLCNLWIRIDVCLSSLPAHWILSSANKGYLSLLGFFLRFCLPRIHPENIFILDGF